MIGRGLSVVVKGEDLDFVIERCDLVGDGEISLDEVRAFCRTPSLTRRDVI